MASKEGRGDAVAVLLAAGSDAAAVTDTGLTPLHFAAAAGDTKAVGALLEHGGDINVGDETHGRTPLIFAASRNRLKAMEVLIAEGADVYLATKTIDYPARARQDDLDRQTRQRIVDAAKPPEAGGRGGRGARPQQAQQQFDPANAPPNDTPEPDTPANQRGGADPADATDPTDPADPAVSSQEDFPTCPLPRKRGCSQQGRRVQG